jgi:hypothetical protein
MSRTLKIEDYTDSKDRLKKFYFKNTEISFTIQHHVLDICIIGTGTREHFKVFILPTSNCQVISISGFNQLLASTLIYTYCDANGEKVEVARTERIAILKEILLEIQDAVLETGHKFKQILIDVNQEWKEYIFGEAAYLDLSNYLIFKNDYISTNGSDMCMFMIHGESLAKDIKSEFELEEENTATPNPL